jgi:PAS domain S-box-containing protein
MNNSNKHKSSCDILIVDDNEVNREYISFILGREGYKVVALSDGKSILKIIDEKKPELILLDIMMPDLDGFDICKILKANENTSSIPIIFITALDNINDKIKGFKCGAVDYIAKPFNNEEVLIRVKTQLALRSLHTDLEIQNSKLIHEINERKIAEDALRESEQKYRSLHENAGIGIGYYKANGEIISYNILAAKYLNGVPDNFIGKSICEIFPENQAEIYLKRINETIESDSALEYEDLIELNSGNKYFLSTFSKIVDLNENVIGVQVVSQDITKLKETKQDLIRYQKDLQALASQITLVEEKERQRIASNIHDHLSHSLAITKMKLFNLEQMLESDKYSAILDNIKIHINNAIKYSRDLTKELSPLILYELGLIVALEWYISTIEEKYQIKTEIIKNVDDLELSHDQNILVFRCIRELINNIIKHSKATKFAININSGFDIITIEVSDNGIGFDFEEVRKKIVSADNYGLFSIIERVKYFNGNVVVNTNRYIGTKVKLIIPQNPVVKI